VLQQTVLFTQLPLVHCELIPHACPFGTVAHTPFAQ
jgi:hypothetical protein